MDADEGRISLRRVLLAVIPYQLKMECAVLDGVHRMAAVLCASTGACPQSMEAEPRNQVHHFTNRVWPLDLSCYSLLDLRKGTTV